MKVDDLKEFLYDFDDDVEVIIEDAFSSVYTKIQNIKFIKETKTIIIVSGDQLNE